MLLWIYKISSKKSKLRTQVTNMSSFTNPSPVLFIARAFPNITERRIRGVIGALNIGEVERVDIKPWNNKEGKSFNKLYIHLNWNTEPETQNIIERLNSGKEIKIVYDDPWFWKVCAYKNSSLGARGAPRGGAPRGRPRAKIEIPDDLAQQMTHMPELANSMTTSPRTPPPRDIEEGSGSDEGLKLDYGGTKAIPKKKLTLKNPETIKSNGP